MVEMQVLLVTVPTSCHGLQWNPLASKPDMSAQVQIEEICTSSKKEEIVESGLSDIVQEWSHALLTFAPYKARGNVILKVGHLHCLGAGGKKQVVRQNTYQLRFMVLGLDHAAGRDGRSDGATGRDSSHAGKLCNEPFCVTIPNACF